MTATKRLGSCGIVSQPSKLTLYRPIGMQFAAASFLLTRIADQGASVREGPRAVDGARSACARSGWMGDSSERSTAWTLHIVFRDKYFKAWVSYGCMGSSEGCCQQRLRSAIRILPFSLLFTVCLLQMLQLHFFYSLSCCRVRCGSTVSGGVSLMQSAYSMRTTPAAINWGILHSIATLSAMSVVASALTYCSASPISGSCTTCCQQRSLLSSPACHSSRCS